MNNEIRKYVSRYVVPFYFNYEDDGYDKIVKSFTTEKKDYKALGIPKDSRWVKKDFGGKDKNDKISKSEIDIYTYLLELLREEKESLNEASLGTAFELKTSGSLFNLCYVSDKERKGIDFRCKDLGILLFKNGVGFIWYDIDLGKTITTDEYLEFQHEFIELSRTHSNKFRRKTGRDIYETFCMGKWLAQFLNTSVLGIKFWAERKTWVEETDSEMCIPDKSLLFQYVFINTAEKQERMDIAFQIANGYDKKYNPPSTLASEIYEPFGNACFYISKTGMAYVVSDDESNGAFFENNFKEKFIKDYFFIYVLLLYQTYSCAHYSRLLTKLPADLKAVEKKTVYTDRMKTLEAQINLFLVKSTYESVSNIQHQNGVYIYGKKVLRIEEDVKSLTAGLTALRGIEEEKQRYIVQRRKDKKDRAINKGLIIFGFIVVVSAALDALNLVDWFCNEQTTINVWHIVALGGIGSLTLFMIVVLIVNTLRK